MSRAKQKRGSGVSEWVNERTDGMIYGQVFGCTDRLRDEKRDGVKVRRLLQVEFYKLTRLKVTALRLRASESSP